MTDEEIIVERDELIAKLETKLAAKTREADTYRLQCEADYSEPDTQAIMRLGVELAESITREAALRGTLELIAAPAESMALTAVVVKRAKNWLELPSPSPQDSTALTSIKRREWDEVVSFLVDDYDYKFATEVSTERDRRFGKEPT